MTAKAPPRRLRPPPDLRALVRQYGGYAAIPPAAWAEHDRAVEAYRALMRTGNAEISDEGALP